MELDPNLYTVAWIAPLEIEAKAALYMLDNRHEGRFTWKPGYDCLFHVGDINGHNVIIATLPAGQQLDTGSAAALANQIKTFFPNIRFGLLVGVATGLPNLSKSPPRDIRLGDVLVGLPDRESAGIVGYELGKETKHGFRSAIGHIKIEAPHDTDCFLPFYKSIQDKTHANCTFLDPGQDRDKLYRIGKHGVEYAVKRVQRPDSRRTRVWSGSLGSGEKLMENGEKSDALRDKYTLIGLEIGAADVMNQIPVGVIRGVCDYGDEYKNEEWQPYASAMAAAYAKAVLYQILPRRETTHPIFSPSDSGISVDVYQNYNNSI
ncbi:hypothetical protein PISL3812_05853 [Talaromyces islandicus]|uniref:Nucleoside phosphorylase domain-containing protein n=1 Tax=Talaromyces islandicus TaxID=28573 RepID=A0A0U1LZT7_TALIS|nr:hypothetical protein PISL3812_05853 [Talaromyces islandicus]